MRAPVHIHIAVPFYKTSWFLIFSIVAIFSAAFAAIYFRQRMKFASILQAQRIRNSIASDLHNDIGSSLSSIMLMSELVKKQPQLAENYWTQVSKTAGKVIENMNDIVWAINPEHDSFEQLVFKMQGFALGLLEKKNIITRFEWDEQLKSANLNMRERRNIYLIFKEALHNSFKYADCTFVTIQIMYKTGNLIMEIGDDGKGFDEHQISQGNGLNNFRKRCAEIGAAIQITSSVGKGTNIIFKLKTTLSGSYF